MNRPYKIYYDLIIRNNNELNIIGDYNNPIPLAFPLENLYISCVFINILFYK